jgi:hypothetical protein
MGTFLKINFNVLNLSIIIILYSLESNAFQTDSLNNNFENELVITYQKLKECGYVPMPLEIQNSLLTEIKNEMLNDEKKNVYSLFSQINSEANYYTLSNNTYSEILLQPTTHNIANSSTGLLLTTHNPQPTTIIDPVSFALSIDPLSDQFPSISPYNAMGNNPIKYIDPDGKKITLAENMSAFEQTMILNNLQRLTDDQLEIYANYSEWWPTAPYVVKIKKMADPNAITKTSGTELVRRLIISRETVELNTGRTKPTFEDTYWYTMDYTIRLHSGAGDSWRDFGEDDNGNIRMTSLNNGRSWVGLYLDFEKMFQQKTLNRNTSTQTISLETSPFHISLANSLIKAEKGLNGNHLFYFGLWYTHPSLEYTIKASPLELLPYQSFLKSQSEESSYSLMLSSFYNPLGLTQKIYPNDISAIGLGLVDRNVGDITENDIRKEQGLNERIAK